jgi:hypothetical protein
MGRGASESEVSLPLDRYALARSSPLNEVRRVYSDTATPTRVEVPVRERFQCRLNYAAIGPVTISTIWSRRRIVAVAETPLSSDFLSLARAGQSEHVSGNQSSAVAANHSGVCASPRRQSDAGTELFVGRVSTSRPAPPSASPRRRV